MRNGKTRSAGGLGALGLTALLAVLGLLGVGVWNIWGERLNFSRTFAMAARIQGFLWIAVWGLFLLDSGLFIGSDLLDR